MDFWQKGIIEKYNNLLITPEVAIYHKKNATILMFCTFNRIVKAGI